MSVGVIRMLIKPTHLLIGMAIHVEAVGVASSQSHPKSIERMPVDLT